MRRPKPSSNEPSASTGERPGPTARALAGAVRAYQLIIRPALPPSCRFTPTCSDYAHAALLTHGVRRGVFLALRRLSRCHAWHPGGYDPVPELEG